MEQFNKKGQKNKIGACGELIAQKYLENKGLELIERNFLRKYGEIDLVMRQHRTDAETKTTSEHIHFVEVKTVSYKTKSALQVAQNNQNWRPEEQVHAAKLHKLHRIITVWLLEHDYEGEWQLDVVAVRLVPSERYASVKYLENIVID